MTDHHTNQLYAQKLFADELREEQSVLVRALKKISGWKGYSGRLLRECPSDLSEEALEEQHYERGANDMRYTLAEIAEDALASVGIETPAANGTATVLAEIVAERRRQIIAEGFTPKHDDTHTNGEIAAAAACYAAGVRIQRWPGSAKQSADLWPWAPAWWKPKGRRRDLIRAAALIVAEVERLDRASAK